MPTVIESIRNLPRQKSAYVKAYQTVISNQYSLDFDGSNDYITIPHSSALSITGNLTIECWAYFDINNDYEFLLSNNSIWSDK
jgi:hypothetical protein